MKKLLVLAALTMAAAPALASKARLSSLGNSIQLVDTQTIFLRPADLVSLGNWATVELGATAPSTGYGTFSTTTGAYTAPTTPYAEGGFSRSMGDSYFGFYMGHHNDQVAFGRAVALSSGLTGALPEENPIDLYYAAKMGDMAWGAGLWYSNSDKKTLSTKQSSLGVRGSVAVANVDAYIAYGITDSTENATVKYTGSTPITLGVGYTMDPWYFYADMNSEDGKVALPAGDAKASRSSYRIGAINTTKGEGSNFFWGISYEGYNQGKDIAPLATTALPFILGVEHDATSWLTVRGSVKQTVLLSSTRTVGDANTMDNNTTAAAGVGIKFNKLVLDASIAKTAGAQTGDINGNNLLSNAALTYMF